MTKKSAQIAPERPWPMSERRSRASRDKATKVSESVPAPSATPTWARALGDRTRERSRLSASELPGRDRRLHRAQFLPKRAVRQPLGGEGQGLADRDPRAEERPREPAELRLRLVPEKRPRDGDAEGDPIDEERHPGPDAPERPRQDEQGERDGVEGDEGEHEPADQPARRLPAGDRRSDRAGEGGEVADEDGVGDPHEEPAHSRRAVRAGTRRAR